MNPHMILSLFSYVGMTRSPITIPGLCMSYNLGICGQGCFLTFILFNLINDIISFDFNNFNLIFGELP